MSTVGTLTKTAADLAHRVIGTAGRVALHPVATASSVAGQARRAAGTVLGGARDVARDAAPESGSAPATDAPLDPVLVEPFPEAPVIEPVEPQEPSFTEPKAASREAAHSGRGADPTDDWHDELDEDDDELELIPGDPVADDEPLLDPSVAKAVRKEAETMSKAADPAGE